ncbi:N-acetyl-gamma-glutamyl-phosphate reductase [Anaerovorax odorimutans]|uniref:N-acetyl-gamma-glutamyl-phosphate reductase n=1 Tax=Anaerovorax odorimutans TaxID=109327 RepID=UPI0003FB1636|nr:N-acetyl-gamma-glutamyl-phosphate reductase [Anaerovorax odorimutans]
MAYKVFIDGQEGTTGLKIFERFQHRDDIDVITIESEKRKDLKRRLEMMKKADITFLCLPDTASKEIIAEAPISARVLDTSTAHRTNKDWVYGFPELNKEQRKLIKESNRVAVPGCHATGFISLVNPLIKLGIANKDYPFTCHSITGYSGGGKKMIAEYESSDRDNELNSPREYGLSLKHKHLKEMKAITGIDYAPVFSPIVADYYSGMLASVPIHTRMLNKKITPKELHELLSEYYSNQNFVKVKAYGKEPESGLLGSNNLSGKNTLEIFVFGNEEQILLAARYDNLGKGASGAAMQCMNIMLELPEQTGLI